MNYIDVLFISSMEYNIYFYWPTTYKSCCIKCTTIYIYIILKIIVMMIHDILLYLLLLQIYGLYYNNRAWEGLHDYYFKNFNKTFYFVVC